jgi:hypothetical protein
LSMFSRTVSSGEACTRLEQMSSGKHASQMCRGLEFAMACTGTRNLVKQL